MMIGTPPPLSLWLHFEVARPPGLIEPGLQRPIEPQNNSVALAWYRLHPAAFMTGRGFRSEPDRGATIRILLDARMHAVETCRLLIGRKQRAGLVVVNRQGPEVLRGDRSR